MNFLVLVSLIISLDSGIHYPYLDPGNSRSLTREEYVERIRDRDTVLYEVLKARWFGEDVEDSKVPVEPYNMGIVGHWTFRYAYAVLMDGDIFYVVAGGGLFIYHVTDSGLEKVSELSVLVTHNGEDIVKYGDYLYVTFVEKLGIIDVSDPENPRLVGFYTDISDTDTVRFYYGVVVDDYLYVSVLEGGRLKLHVLSLRYPEHPVKVGEWSGYYNVLYLDYDSVTGYLYASSNYDDVCVFNISQRERPIFRRGKSFGGYVSNVVGEGGYIYVLVDYYDEYGSYSYLKMLDANSLSVLDSRCIGEIGDAVGMEGDYVYACAFDGYVGNGLYIYHVEDTGGLSWVAREQLDDDCSIRDVSADGGYVGIGAKTAGMVYDVGDPSNPLYIGSVPCPGTAGVCGIRGDYFYYASSWSGTPPYRLWVIDVTDRAHPVSVNVIDLERKPVDIEFWSNYMFLLYPDTGLYVYDISNPSEPVLVNTFYLDSLVGGIVINYPAAYVNRIGGIYILDITDPEDIKVLGIDTLLKRLRIRKDSLLIGFYQEEMWIGMCREPFTPEFCVMYQDTETPIITFTSMAWLDSSYKYAYFGDGYWAVGDIMDLTDPYNPRYVYTKRDLSAYYVYDFLLPYIVVKTSDYSFAVVEVRDTINFEVVASASTPYKLGWIVRDYPYIYVTSGYPGIVVYRTYLTGVDERVAESDLFFTVSPVVVRDRVNIVLSEGLGGGEVLVRIYDVVGREVRRLSYGLVGRDIVIDMGGLRQGIYFISVEVGSCKGVRRIVKIGG
ncbi:MAG: hypothetical protein J7J61_00595 [Candidatus Hydrothermae bacterium]|nr:hypothetical protein [Candidatus Hydrothermae bacterium]